MNRFHPQVYNKSVRDDEFRLAKLEPIEDAGLGRNPQDMIDPVRNHRDPVGRRHPEVDQLFRGEVGDGEYLAMSPADGRQDVAIPAGKRARI